MNNYKSLYEFSVDVEREVEKTTTTEQADGKKITETVKVKEKVPVYFSFKKPSRMEREAAEEERVSWWSRYVEKGILPEALLIKTYANYGGIMSNSQKDHYVGLQKELFGVVEDLRYARANEKENLEKINALTDKMIRLRSDIIDFQQEQSVFFDNTAEAKAKGKLVEYLLLNLSYFRTDPSKDWEQYFKGKDVDEKMDFLEHLEETEDEVYLKAKDKLLFISAIYSSAGGNIKREEIEEIAAGTV